MFDFCERTVIISNFHTESDMPTERTTGEYCMAEVCISIEESLTVHGSDVIGWIAFNTAAQENLQAISANLWGEANLNMKSKITLSLGASGSIKRSHQSQSASAIEGHRQIYRGASMQTLPIESALMRALTFIPFPSEPCG